MITKITPNERTVTVKQDSSLTLECIAQGYPTPSIKWFKNVSAFPKLFLLIALNLAFYYICHMFYINYYC